MGLLASVSEEKGSSGIFLRTLNYLLWGGRGQVSGQLDGRSYASISIFLAKEEEWIGKLGIERGPLSVTGG